ncbi:MAG: P-loop NTPase fold protein [Telluria sp.]
MDKLIAQLIEGPDARRHEVLTHIRGGRFDDPAALASRLVAVIYGTYGARTEVSSNLSSARRNAIAVTRSWMLSALIWSSRHDPRTAKTIVDHVDLRREPKSFVRYWALAEAYLAGVGYLERLVQVARTDGVAEVSTLAHAIGAQRGELTERFRRTLTSGDWSDVTAVLRALRFVPDAALVPEVCALLNTASAPEDELGEVLIALAHADIVHLAAPLLTSQVGIPRFVRLAMDACSNQRFIPSDSFADLLNAVGEKQIVPALRAHLGDLGWGKAAGKLLDSMAHGASAAAAPCVAGYSSDAVGHQVDRLGIAAEVRILTAIMLARDVTPPLAIGLFGAWGSGKSFFMRAMRESGERLAQQAAATPGSTFCAHVVQIEFNAWHYADTNLWASLATFILDSLAAKVVPPADGEAMLAQDLAGAQAETRAAQLEQHAAQARLQQEGQSLQELKAQREGRELELADITAAQVAALVAADPDLKASLQDAFVKLGLPAAWHNVEQLERRIGAALDTGGRAAALFSQLMDPANRKIAIVTLFLLLALPLAAYAVTRFVADAGAMAIATAVIGQVSVAVVGLTRWLGRGIGIVNAGLNQIERARQQVEQLRARQRAIPTEAETRLAASIETLKAQEHTASVHLGAAAARVQEIETRLKELREEKTLARFLSDRTKSDDYRKHLGLISTVRGDFEALAKRLGDPANAQVERIVLYIDDLDRCPAAKVVDVLQAVHLLLAYPLFVVVVGVDSRWLLQSLSAHYTELGSAATPQHYLEKIFQIPYSLEPMSDAGYGRLIGELMAGPAPAPAVRETTAAPAPQTAAARATGSGAGAPIGHAAQALPASVAAAPTAEAFPSQRDIEEDALVLQPWESRFAATLHAFIPTPRAAKRLSNVYRILKARVPSLRLHLFEGSAEAPGEFQVPLLLLAVLISDSKGASGWFSDVLDGLDGDGGMQEALLCADARFADITDAVARVIADARFPLDKTLLAEWIPYVRRFSFDLAGRC